MFTKQIDKPCCTITCKINIKIMTAGCGFGCTVLGLEKIVKKPRKNRLAYALLMPLEVVVTRGEAFTNYIRSIVQKGKENTLLNIKSKTNQQERVHFNNIL